MAGHINLCDIMMPMGAPDPNKKQRVADTVNGKPIPKGANKEAIEAATRARNRIRGCPPPPNLPMPRAFKRFKSSKAPPPPPPKKRVEAAKGGPNYQTAGPTNEHFYETNQPVKMENSFVPSGSKRAVLEKKVTQGNVISAGPSQKPPPPPTKSINTNEMKLFVPRGMKGSGSGDTVTIKRNKRIPPPPPKPSGNKDDDEYAKFMHSLKSWKLDS